MAKLFSKKQILPPGIKAIDERKKVRIIRLKGDIGTSAVSQLEQFAAEARLQKGYEYKHILLDFAEVTSMDSSAVAALLKALNVYKRTYQKLAMINLREEPQSMIQLAKVGQLFPSYANEAQAIKDLETRL